MQVGRKKILCFAAEQFHRKNRDAWCQYKQGVSALYGVGGISAVSSTKDTCCRMHDCKGPLGPSPESEIWDK